MFLQHACVLLRVCHVLCPRLQREAWDGYFLTGAFRPRIHLLNLLGLVVELESDVTPTADRPARPLSYKDVRVGVLRPIAKYPPNSTSTQGRKSNGCHPLPLPRPSCTSLPILNWVQAKSVELPNSHLRSRAIERPSSNALYPQVTKMARLVSLTNLVTQTSQGIRSRSRN